MSLPDLAQNTLPVLVHILYWPLVAITLPLAKILPDLVQRLRASPTVVVEVPLCPLQDLAVAEVEVPLHPLQDLQALVDFLAETASCAYAGIPRLKKATAMIRVQSFFMGSPFKEV